MDKTKVLVIGFLVVALALGLGVGGFTAYQYFNINTEPDQYNEKEFQRYMEQMSESEPARFDSVDAITKDTVEEGMYICFKGVVQEVKREFIAFGNGIKCYFIREAMNDEEKESVNRWLGQLNKGDEVELKGMVSNVEEGDISIKYCGLTEGNVGINDTTESNNKADVSSSKDSNASVDSKKNDKARSVWLTNEEIERIEGIWQDRTSQRAMMSIEFIKDDIFSISATWGSSAFESVVWELTAEYDPTTNTLIYKDCHKYILSADEDGNEIKETVYKKGSGKFRLEDDGYIYWESDVTDIVADCQFEHVSGTEYAD